MPRLAIKDFELANPIYRGASVTFYTVAVGVKTATKATLYQGVTGATQLANPQKLDAHGKFKQPVYIEVPVIGAVDGISIPSHDTGIISPAPTLRVHSTAEVQYSFDNGVSWSTTGMFALRHRGAWAGAIDYKRTDVVSANNNTYIALSDHTSSALFATDLAASKWIEFISAVNFLAALGITSSVGELNLLDGVTASAAELNILDGVLASANELNILDGATLTTAELNVLDGLTASTAELNILGGALVTTAELNALDGIVPGVAVADKALVPDANKDLSGLRNVTLTGWLLYQTSVEAIATGVAEDLALAESGKLFTNEGAGARQDFNLPGVAAAGAGPYTFYCADTDGVRVIAAAGETIRLAGSVTAAAGRIDSTAIGSCVTLVAINATEWMATSIVGTWGVT